MTEREMIMQILTRLKSEHKVQYMEYDNSCEVELLSTYGEPITITFDPLTEIVLEVEG